MKEICEVRGCIEPAKFHRVCYCREEPFAPGSDYGEMLTPLCPMHYHQSMNSGLNRVELKSGYRIWKQTVLLTT